MSKLTPAQLRALTYATVHVTGRVLSSALPAASIDKLSQAGLIERDGYAAVGPLWRITLAGREAVRASLRMKKTSK